MAECEGRTTMVTRRAHSARMAPGWIRRDDEIYVSEDDRFKAIRGKNQTWLLVTDKLTNNRAIADCIAQLPEVRRRMEAYA